MKIEFDPNIRISSKKYPETNTYVGYENVPGPISVGDTVFLVESESGLYGTGLVLGYSDKKEIFYIKAYWDTFTYGVI